MRDGAEDRWLRHYCVLMVVARLNVWRPNPPLRRLYTLVDTWRLILSRTANVRLQRWGNSLAVRIPASIARSVGFSVGRPVEVTPHESGVLVTPKGEVYLSLAQKLALFDPRLHGGEAMATTRGGNEVL